MEYFGIKQEKQKEIVIKTEVMRVSEIEKTLLEKFRYNSNSYFLLAEKMYLSCKRKQERKELFKGSFEGQLLTLLLPLLENAIYLQKEIHELLQAKYGE